MYYYKTTLFHLHINDLYKFTYKRHYFTVEFIENFTLGDLPVYRRSTDTTPGEHCTADTPDQICVIDVSGDAFKKFVTENEQVILEILTPLRQIVFLCTVLWISCL